MADKLFNFSLACPIHPKFPITHGCSLNVCNSQVLHCSACLIESVDHTHNHQTSIIPISNYYSVTYSNIEQAKEKIKPFFDILNSKDDHFAMYSNFIKSKKKNIEAEFNKLLDSITYFIEKLKEVSFKRLEDGEILLKKLYDKLEFSLSSPDLDFLKFQSETQLSEKVSSFERSKVEGYLQNLRKKINDLENPKTSAIYKSLTSICYDLKNFRKDREERKLEFSEYNSKYLKPYLSEIEKCVKDHVSVICQNVSKSVSSGLSTPSYSEIMKHQKIQNFQKTPSNIEYPMKHLESINFITKFEKDSDANFIDLKTKESNEQPFDDYETKSMSKKFERIFAFPSHTKTEPDQEKSYPTQNSPLSKKILKPQSLQKETTQKEDWHKGKLKLVFSLGVDYSTTAITSLKLSKNRYIVSSKDYLLRIVEMNSNDDSMRIMTEFEIQTEPCFFTTLILLSTTNGVFLCGGNNKGNIYIWNLEDLESNLEKGKTPLANLVTKENEEITSIVDLGNNSHLLSATNQGSLLLWNYMQGVLEAKIKLPYSNSSALFKFNDSILYVNNEGTVLTLSLSFPPPSNHNPENEKPKIIEKQKLNLNIPILDCLLIQEGLWISTDEHKLTLLNPSNLKILKEIKIGTSLYQILEDNVRNSILGFSQKEIYEVGENSILCSYSTSSEIKLISEPSIGKRKSQILDFSGSPSILICGESRFDKELLKLIKLD